MARFCFSITGNATTYPNRANILSRSEKKLEKLKKKRSTEKWTRIKVPSSKKKRLRHEHSGVKNIRKWKMLDFGLAEYRHHRT